jgi:hypothetical protein
MTHFLLKTRARYFWWLVSTVLGASVGVFLTNTHFLDTPVQAVVAMMRPVMSMVQEVTLSLRLERSIVRTSASFFLTLPRTVLAGILVGALAFKAPYPRTLLYSVIGWPLVVLISQYWVLVRFEEGAKLLGFSPQHAVTFQLDLMQSVMFWILIAVVFYLFAFLAYQGTKSLCAQRAVLKPSNIDDL